MGIMVRSFVERCVEHLGISSGVYVENQPPVSLRLHIQKITLCPVDESKSTGQRFGTAVEIPLSKLSIQ